MSFLGKILEKTSAKILVIALGIIALFLIFLFAYIFPLMQEALMDSRKMAAKNLVDSVCNLVESYRNRAQQGEITEEYARLSVIERIRHMRFSDNGYIWINDNARPYPRMILHPALPELEGRIMKEDLYKTAVAMQPGPDRSEIRFSKEKRHFFQVFSEVAGKNGSGFVEYQWYRPLSQGVTKDLYIKKSYVRLFAPWDWIIGTGVYIDDVYAHMNHLKLSIISMAGLIFLIAMAGTLVVMRTITKPIYNLVDFATRVSEGEIDAEIQGRVKGEMARLNIAISRMVGQLRIRMNEAEERAKEAEAARQALKSSQDRFELAIRGTNDGIWELNLQTNEVFFSKRWKEILGYRDDELENILEEWESRVHPDDYLKAVGVRHFFLQSDTDQFEAEYRMQHKDGSYRWILGRAACLRGQNGKPVRLTGAHTDITEKKQADEALRKSEEKYRILVENAQESIFVIQDGRLKFANRNRKFTNYSIDELASKPFATFAHPDDQPMLMERHQKRLKGIYVPPSYSFRIIDKTGEVIWVELKAVKIDWEGRPATLNFLNNITEQKKAEQERKELEKRLRQAQKIEAIGTLTGGVAHDFNNILSIIMGFTELVQAEIPRGHPAEKGLNQISAATVRAREVVRQLLTFSRGAREDKTPQNISLTIKEGMRMLKSTLPSHIDITEDISTDLPMVWANPTQIHQLIINLCKNASDAMNENGGSLKVGLKSERLKNQVPAFGSRLSAGDYVMLTVSDTGHGISADSIDKIFDPYFTTKEIDKGTGLGLSVVLGIVRDLGGAIRVESSNGKGTKFEIYFPVMAETGKEPSDEQSF
jgi:PAS domain S-box-containing protein